MKYLYISTRDIEGICNPKAQVINDFMFGETQIFCTKLCIHRNQIRSDFIVKSYKFNILLVDIKQKEINMFLEWKDRCFPEGIESHVNIYETRDKDVCLYMLGTDIDLMITGYFYKKFIPVLTIVTSVADETAI